MFHLLNHKSSDIREKAFDDILQTNGVKVQDVLPAFDDSMRSHCKILACKLVEKLVTFEEVPVVIPPIISCMVDMDKKVVLEATKTLEHVCTLINNKDLDPFIPALIKCIKNVDQIPECVHKLAATTFVHRVEAPALAFMAPLLQRGLDASQKVAVRRKSAVIIDNMCKLVEHPDAVKPFLPYLLPGLENASENTSDPECRTVAARARGTLVRVSGGDVVTEDDSAQLASEDGEDLCKCEFSLAYGALILLSNTFLHLKRGKRYGLCGANGCGKSTLLKAIANGQLEGFPPAEELKTVYVMADIQEDMDQYTVVAYTQLGTDAKDDDVRKQLTDLGFTDVMMSGVVSALSGGWRMKLALARAMLMKADIFLLDEPTNHMDTTNVKWLENYLCSQTSISSIIVSHDSGFLDNVCTHIIHYENRKLKTYMGNLQKFVERCPEAKKYYELSDDVLSFTFPTPGYLEGVKNKDKPIVKLIDASFHYPGSDRMIINNCTLQVSLYSRVGCQGPNGAGKSTLIKMMTGETEPTSGTMWKHQNMRYAYVAQHAFHHVEQHLMKSPNEYIQWRFSSGEDKENLEKVTAIVTPEEQAKMDEKITVTGQEWQEPMVTEKLSFDRIMGRRQKKNSYEYEIQWKGKSSDCTTWMMRDKLEALGFTKLLNRIDEREAARQGLYARPLTQKNVEKHLEDFGLEAEFGTHNRIKGLSGGQKVKVVLAAAMWNQPHVIVMDEPTNYLDRDALGALATAIKTFGGGAVVISHNTEFIQTVCEETWSVPGDGYVHITGNKWGGGRTKAEVVEWKQQEEITDALGNTVKVKAPKKKLSRKEIKARAKLRRAALERGDELSDDSDWELDEYIV